MGSDIGGIEAGSAQAINALPEEALRNPTGFQRSFFSSELSTTPDLQRVVDATVLISEAPQSPGGSGVIIRYDGKKYLVTAAHVISTTARDDKIVRYFYRDSNGALQEKTLNREELLFFGPTAEGNGFQPADLVIIPFDGDNEGVEMSDLEMEIGRDADQVGAAIGFPFSFYPVWEKSTKPLISVGNMYKDSKDAVAPSERETIDRYVRLTGKEWQDLRVFYEGRIDMGNSGGPLVDGRGRVLAICNGTTHGGWLEDSGTYRFVDFRPVLRDIVQEAA